ncbi:MAG: M14 family zinc carboxypeptidase [Pyrinomonadaceae bacterium]
MRTRINAFALLFALLFSFLPATHVVRAQKNGSTALASSSSTASVPAPEDVLGFRPGDDRRLASWAQVIEYFQKLDAASDRVKFEELGKTTMGAPFVLATISAPENLARLEEYKKIQQQLADPRTLQPNADRRAAGLIARGKTIVLITCGIHSDEVGSYLSSMLIAHRLASSDEPQIKNILQNNVILLVPSLNPDGVDIVKNWYDKTLGTPYEGTEPPELYHKYVGHDDNRDWYAFTQVETQITVDKIHNVWHPQIVHDIHQQGAYGARLFLPPYMQPVEPNVPKQIVEGYTELGHAMAADLRARGFKGITWDSTYDAWTPSRAYSHYHGGVRILSETASAKLATPITVKPSDLAAREGYDARKASANFPDPWPGGEWHLRDITNYMTTAAFALLNHAAVHRAEWLQRFYEIGKDAVRPRKNGELFGFIIEENGDEGSHFLSDVLFRAGVDVEGIASSVSRGKRTEYANGTSFVRLDQPYGGFAKSLLERQAYPNLRDASGNPIQPYDVTAHTLSLLAGAEVHPVYAPFRYTQPGPMLSAIHQRKRAYLGNVSIGIYKSNVPSIDEGWTRWIIEQWSYHAQDKKDYVSLGDARVRAGSLRADFDAIIIPDQSPRAILNGYRPGTMPTELTGDLGAEGVRRLREFVEQGGTLICLNRASDFAIEQLNLPVRDITEGLSRKEFYAPGSILRTELDTSHPIAAGMPRESIAWIENSPVFEIKSDPLALVRVRIIARYPANSNPLLSGWLLGGERIKGKAALLEVGMGKGRIYLFGFRPQYRGQSLATYPLLFNAITH